MSHAKLVVNFYANVEDEIQKFLAHSSQRLVFFWSRPDNEG
jgi:predicted GNAT superfamily acetyltransferase